MKGELLITKKELLEVLNDIRKINELEQFTIGIEKQRDLVYWHVRRE